jgi:hypothetical protein
VPERGVHPPDFATRGQNSLVVFCLGIVLAFCARAAIETRLDSLSVQIFVGTIGILFLTASAYYWS